jgi:hypothetical protein
MISRGRPWAAARVGASRTVEAWPSSMQIEDGLPHPRYVACCLPGTRSQESSGMQR